MRSDPIAPRTALELGRLYNAAPEDADGVRLADPILFHLFERVAGENDLAAREDGPLELLGFCGRQRLYER
jgi:hypothetical protein